MEPKRGPTLVTKQVDGPSAFARTLFIEALQNAGLTVTAPALGPNPESLLPAAGSYQASDMLGEHVLAPLFQFAKLILNVSYNRGADDMTCLVAVKLGSTECYRGLVAEMNTIKSFGIPATSVFPYDGAGSDPRNRTAPAAFVVGNVPVGKPADVVGVSDDQAHIVEAIYQDL